MRTTPLRPVGDGHVCIEVFPETFRSQSQVRNLKEQQHVADISRGEEGWFLHDVLKFTIKHNDVG